MSPGIRLQNKLKTSTELESSSWEFVECPCFSDPREPKTSTQVAVPKLAPVSYRWWWFAAALSTDTSVFTKSPLPWHCFALVTVPLSCPFPQNRDPNSASVTHLVAF